MLQPGVLKALQNGRAFRYEGVLGRVLWCRPPHRLGERLTGADVPPLDVAAAGRYARALRALLDMESAGFEENSTPIPHKLRLSPGAIAQLHAWKAEVERDLADGGCYATVRDWAGKMVGQSIRVAALLELAARAGDGRLLPDDTIGQRRWAGRSTCSARWGRTRLRSWSGTSRSTRAPRCSNYVLRRARELPEGSTVRDLHQHCKGRAGAESVGDVREKLDLLAKRGCIRLRHDDRPGPGRPSSPIVDLHPALTKSILTIPAIRRQGDSENSENADSGLSGENDLHPADCVLGGPL